LQLSERLELIGAALYCSQVLAADSWQVDDGRSVGRKHYLLDFASNHATQPDSRTGALFWAVVAENDKLRQFFLQARNYCLPLATVIWPEDAGGSSLGFRVVPGCRAYRLDE
jgi:hypothetical protein